MKSYFVVLIFICINFLSCSNNKNNSASPVEFYEQSKKKFEEGLNEIADKKLRSSMEWYGNIVFHQEYDRLQLEIPPKETEYTNNPNVLLTNYSSLKELTNNYIDGLLPSVRHRLETKCNIFIHEPFRYPFMITSEWKEAYFEKDEKILFTKVENPYKESKSNSLQAIQVNNINIDIRYSSKKLEKIPTKLKASFEVKYPEQIHKFKFTQEELSKTKNIEGISISLLALKNGIAQIKVVTPELEIFEKSQMYQIAKWLKISATDAKGKYLAKKSYKINLIDTLYSALYQELISNEEYTPEFVRAFVEKSKNIAVERNLKYGIKKKNTRYLVLKFKGEIDELELNVFDYRKSKRLIIEKEYDVEKLKSYYRDEEIPSFKSNANIYNNMIGYKLESKYELTEQEVKSQISISQRPQYDEKFSVIRFKYPDVFSSELVFNANRFSILKEVKFYDKNNKLIDIPNDSIGFNIQRESNRLVDFTMGKIEYDEMRFPETPFYARGILKIPLVKIKKEDYKIDNLPENIQLEGGILKTKSALPNSNQSYPVGKFITLMKDSTQQYLKCFFESDAYYSNHSDQFKDIYYYYGTPESVEVYTVSDVQEVDYFFDIELTREVYKRR